jgi:hypothetical protein
MSLLSKLVAVMCLSARCALALSVQFIGASMAGRAGEPAAEARAQNQTTLTESAAVGAVRQARTHPAYQVFAARLRLPTMTVVDGGTTLHVGGRLKLDLRKPDETMAQEGTTLANLLEIPQGVFVTLVRKLSSNARLGGEDLAHEFQMSVVDYKYLSERWQQYHPGKAGESVRTEALKCLQAGDLERAWQLFIELPKPRPPTGFRTGSPQQSTGQ